MFFYDLLDFFFPRHCAMCGTRLRQDEKVVCINCLTDIMETTCRIDDTVVQDVHVEHLFHLTKLMEDTRQAVHALKYRGHPEVGVLLGRVMAKAMGADMLADIDMIVPVPLHWRRFLSRGYNQSDSIAEGISQETGVPVNKRIVKRIKHFDSLALRHRNKQERRQLTTGIYNAYPHAPISGKHLLLVDDVYTTGSTLSSCMAAILERYPDVRFSVCTLTYVSDTIKLSGTHPEVLSPLPTPHW